MKTVNVWLKCYPSQLGSLVFKPEFNVRVFKLWLLDFKILHYCSKISINFFNNHAVAVRCNCTKWKIVDCIQFILLIINFKKWLINKSKEIGLTQQKITDKLWDQPKNCFKKWTINVHSIIFILEGLRSARQLCDIQNENNIIKLQKKLTFHESKYI